MIFFKRLKQKILNQAGLTLTEILVSLVLISIVLLTFFSFFSQTTLFSGKNEERLVAFHLATKTLNIVESNYRNASIPSDNLQLSCGNYPLELKAALQASTCYYQNNNKNYYPEIFLSKQLDMPTLYVIQIKIYNSPNSTERKLLSETYGYVRVK